MNRFPNLLFLLPALFALQARAQIFGGTPPSVKWKSVSSIPANIIYPPGMDIEASQVAFLVTALNKATLSTIGSRQMKVDIVFHNLTIVPNGYVQLAPFRSEFQLTPPQNSFELGSLPWNQMLAIHEYRHVQQYNNFCVGFARAFYFLFGQDGLAFANSLAVPNWFFEGDAVYQETLVSQQGRGRLPLFLTGYEALWVSKKNYSWMKLRNGSYRDYTPDHYPLGYMMVAYGRDVYGKDFWAKTADESAAFKGLFYPLQKAIQRNSNISFDTFRTRAMNYFQDQLSDDAYNSPEAVFGNSNRHFVADQLFPQFADSNRIIFVNSTYDLPPSFAERVSGKTKLNRVKFRAVAIDDAFSYRNHKIIYTAYEPDLRWGWRDYSVLRVLDLYTKKDKRITTKTKYFSPDISPDGQKIVAVNMSIAGNSSLDILSMDSGRILWQVPNPEKLVYTYPKFYTDNQLISAVRNNRGQMALVQIDITTGNQQVLVDWSMDPIGFISTEKNVIYFTRTFKEQDRGFCLREGQVYPLKNDASSGNYQLSASDGKLTWNSFTSAGFRLQMANSKNAFDEKPVLFNRLDTSENHKVFSLDQPPFQIPFPFPDTIFEKRPYSATTHIFNFHSWRPYINDPDYTLALLGQNVLNTFQSEIYIGYNSNEQYKKAGMDFTYGGLFPFINIGTEYRIDRNAFFKGQKIYWNELLPYFGLSVPLNLSRGRWLTNLEGGANISYHQQYFKGVYKDSISNKAYFSLDPQLLFTHQLQAGRMQIYPSFAQTVLLQYNRAISNIAGNQFLASANLYFPGLTPTHSLVLKGALQKRDSLNQVRFTNSFPFSRGYSGENFYQMYGFGINYNIPLAYPDWGFAELVYFLRIRANVFYDYTAVPYYANNGPGVQSQYRSAGLEIYFDTKWWNQLALSFGVRYSRLLDPDYEGRGPNQWELILPLSILNNGYSNRIANP
ncbi:MAG TPA: hypothetical protein VGI38_07315 [Puia sp.]